MIESLETDSALSIRDGTPRVLIVDDNQSLTVGLAWLFREAGYEPVTFTAGYRAIEYARQSPFSAAIIDIHLPDINGLILTQKLRELIGPKTPIIILSGDGSMEVINSLPHVGATYFFCKPVSGQLLIDRVRDLTA